MASHGTHGFKYAASETVNRARTTSYSTGF